MKEMISSKGDNDIAVAQTSHGIECCMCGDYGLLSELFQCSVCLFRSQHKYCSDLYPKAQSYKVCNWCLKKEETKIKGTHSFSSSYNSNINEDEDNKTKNYGRSTSKLNPIKKQRSRGRSPLLQKKTNVVVVSDGYPKGSSLVRKKSDTRIAKQMFRGRVQRYKLLEEVCR